MSIQQQQIVEQKRNSLILSDTKQQQVFAMLNQLPPDEYDDEDINAKNKAQVEAAPSADKPKEETPAIAIEQKLPTPTIVAEQKVAAAEEAKPQAAQQQHQKPPTPTSQQIKQNEDVIDKLLAENNDDENVQVTATANTGEANLDIVADDQSDVDIDEILNKDEDDLEINEQLYAPTKGFKPQSGEISNSNIKPAHSQMRQADVEPVIDFLVTSKKAFITNILSLEITEVGQQKITPDAVHCIIKVDEYIMETAENERFYYVYDNITPTVRPSIWEMRFVFSFKASGTVSEQEYMKLFPHATVNDQKKVVFDDPKKLASIFVPVTRVQQPSAVFGIKDAPSKELFLSRLYTLMETSPPNKIPQFITNRKQFAKDIGLVKDPKKPPVFATATMLNMIIQEQKLERQRRASIQRVKFAKGDIQAPVVIPARRSTIVVQQEPTVGSLENRSAIEELISNTKSQVPAANNTPQDISLAPLTRANYKDVADMKSIQCYDEIMKVNTPSNLHDSQRRGTKLVVQGDHWVLHCSLNVFTKKDDEDETLQRVLYSNIILPQQQLQQGEAVTSGNDLKKKEKSVVFIFSNLQWYLLEDNNNNDAVQDASIASNNLLRVIATQKYSELKHIDVSFKFQYLRLHIEAANNEKCSYLVLPRDEYMTKRLIQYFVEAGAKFTVKVYSEEWISTWRQVTTSWNIVKSSHGSDDEDDDEKLAGSDNEKAENPLEILGCFSVFAYNMMASKFVNTVQLLDLYPAKVVNSHVCPVTLIVTPEYLFLCEEGYADWKGNGPAAKSPFLSLVSKEEVSDVAHLEKRSDNDCMLTIVFDNDAETKWLIYTAHVTARNAIIAAIEKSWQGSLKISIEVKTIDPKPSFASANVAAVLNAPQQAVIVPEAQQAPIVLRSSSVKRRGATIVKDAQQ